MNTSLSRLRRLPPERSGPIRNPLAREGPGAPSAAGAPRGPLEQGVQTAYAVIDEYMRRGYEAAHGNQKHQNGKDHMSNERPNYGWFNPWGPMMPLMELWATAVRMWTDAWAAFVPGFRPAWPPGPQPGTAPPAVSVSINSQRPTEVTIKLLPGAELKDLRADSFEPLFHGSVTFYPRSEGLYLRIDVANVQAEGTYYGAIRTADGSVVGNLTVVIKQPPEKPSPIEKPSFN
jgi:hypothetical protein